jgi:hypothetical protein
MDAASDGASPDEIAAQLPKGVQDTLRQATTDTAYAPDATINAVNTAARTVTTPPAPEPDPEEPTPPPPGPDPDPEEPPPPPPEPTPDPEPEPDPEPTPPPVNNPPVISGSPTTSLVVGTGWSFTPTASDPDGDALTFSIAGRPTWASFNSSTGRLSGTPGSSHVGTYSNIRISVSDGQATAQLPAFSLTVSPPPNNPPLISGSPDTSLLVGTAWSFTPTASDPDGDTLIFSVTGAPSWMSFNSSTGRLYGTPTSAHVGVHSNIRISVSDGQATASLPAFSVTVTAPAPSLGTAALRWTPPTQRTDGTPLTSISGYRLYYGRNASNLEQVVNLGSSVTEYQVNNLEQGTWYFAITASDSDGVESGLSGMVSKTIP